MTELTRLPPMPDRAYAKQRTDRIWLWLGFIILGTGIIGNVLNHDKQAAASQERRVAGRGTLKVTTVSAYDLYDAYDQNEVAAAGRYTGASLLVRGTIESIGIDRNGVPYVDLAGRWSGSGNGSVRANFTNGSDGVARLSKGEAIAVKCVGVGKGVLVVHLRDCALD